MVTDSQGCTGVGPTYPLTITCPTITVTNPAVDSGTAGAPFSQTFTQSGGVGTTTFSLASGTLPAGSDARVERRALRHADADRHLPDHRHRHRLERLHRHRTDLQR